MSARSYAPTISLLLGACLAALAPAPPAMAQATSSSPQGQGRIVYQATPADGAAGEASGPSTAPATPDITQPAATQDSGVAPAAGPGVEIITGGGGGSPGAAKVGRMPVLQ